MARATRKSSTRSTGKRPSITALYKRFERAHAAYNKIPDAQEKRWERAVDKVGDLVWAIVTAAASNVDEMLLKIRVAGWAIGAAGGKTLHDLDRWKPTRAHCGEETFALASLRGDLQRMKIRELRARREVALSIRPPRTHQPVPF